MKNQFWKNAEKLLNKGVKRFCREHSISERKINRFLRDPSDPSDSHDVCWLKFALHIHQLIEVVAEEKMNRLVRVQAQIHIEQIQAYLTKIS